MKNREQFNKEVIIYERSFIHSNLIPDDNIGAEIESKMLNIISKNEYLSDRSDREKQIFHKLAAACVTLARHARGEVSVCLYPDGNEALIFITAPEFMLSAVSLGNLYNVVIGASGMLIDTDKTSNEVGITIGFSFGKKATRIIDALQL